MMGTEIFKIDAPWTEKLMKTRVSFLMNPTVGESPVDMDRYFVSIRLDKFNCSFTKQKFYEIKILRLLDKIVRRHSIIH